jgi:predicted ATPase
VCVCVCVCVMCSQIITSHRFYHHENSMLIIQPAGTQEEEKEARAREAEAAKTAAEKLAQDMVAKLFFASQAGGDDNAAEGFKELEAPVEMDEKERVELKLREAKEKVRVCACV